MTVTTSSAPRTYGGWRERRGFGVAGMDGRGTAVAIGVGVLAGSACSPPRAAGRRPLLLAGRRGHRAALARRAAAACWPAGTSAFRRARRRGWTRSGPEPGGPRGPQWTLPGPLAPTLLIDALDDQARPWAVVWDRRSGLLTGTLRVAPTSTWLVDPDQVDEWVAAWHAWLAKLGYAPTGPPRRGHRRDHPGLPERPGRGRAPAAGARRPPGVAWTSSRRCWPTHRRPRPAWPPGSRSPSTRRGPAPPLGTLPEQVAEFSRVLDGLARALTGCGVAVLGRATVADVVAWVRGAFDPASRDALTSPTRRAWPGPTPARRPPTSPGTTTAPTRAPRSAGRGTRPPARRSPPPCWPT